MMPVVIALVGGVLLIDGLWLIALDKTNFGTVLPLIIGAAMWMWVLKRRAWQAFLAPSPLRLIAWRVMLAGFALWALSLIGFFAWLSARSPAPPLAAPSVIVSLGSGLLNNQPTPL
jgi:glucose dehydrogenase